MQRYKILGTVIAAIISKVGVSISYHLSLTVIACERDPALEYVLYDPTVLLIPAFKDRSTYLKQVITLSNHNIDKGVNQHGRRH